MISALGVELATAAALGMLLVVRELRVARRRGHIDERMTALAVTGAKSDDESWMMAALVALGRFYVGPQQQRVRIARLLAGAGLFDPRALALFGFLRMASAALGAVAGSLAAAALALSQLPAAILAVLAMIGGFLLPAILLDALASRRMRHLQAELPIIMSLVVMTIESGSSVDQALRFAAQAAERARMRITRSLRTLIDEIGKGAGYEEALGRFGERIDLTEGRDFAALLAQSVTAGTQVGEALHILITDLLEKRVAAAREAIGRRAVLMSVVLIVCFMPVLFILIGAPMGAALLNLLSHGVTK